MTGIARFNHPGRVSPAVLLDSEPAIGPASFGNVRRLQRRLWAAAKQSGERRFHALYDRIYRGDVLWEAWERVRKNRGAAGVDRVTLAYVQEVYGVRRLLGELQADLRAGEYRPAPARRVDIPKPDGSRRAMKRLRDKIRDRTGRNRVGRDIREVIADVNPVLRGWGNYFRTGNAADKFRQADDFVVRRLRTLMVKKRGRNLHAGQAQAWTEDWFSGHGLHRLRGTIRYPKAA